MCIPIAIVTVTTVPDGHRQFTAAFGAGFRIAATPPEDRGDAESPPTADGPAAGCQTLVYAHPEGRPTHARDHSTTSARSGSRRSRRRHARVDRAAQPGSRDGTQARQGT